jgi:glycosyltransferase involved in cell wall biosynthesis
VHVVRVLPTGPVGRLGLVRAALEAAIDLARRRRPSRVLAIARRPTGSGRTVRFAEGLLRSQAYARLATRRPDLLQFEWPTSGIHYFSATEALPCPVLLTCRGSEINVAPHAPTMQATMRGLPRLFGRARAVACVSEALLTEATRYGLDPLKARVVRTGVDTGFFRPPPAGRSASGGLRVVSIGVLRWLKGWEYALLAVAELAGRGIPVSLALFGGDPDEDMATASDRHRIEHTIADLGLADRVVVEGDTEPARVRDALQHADALLHPSLSEGLPNVVLEAMACGLPVVATDVGGTREALTDGVEGFLVPARDPQATAAALERLWHDPGLRARLGAAGRARVEAEFTLEAALDRWVAFYEEAAGNG